MSDEARLDSATEFLSAEPADKDRQAEIEQLSERVIEALRTVYDPEIPVNIFELGLVDKIDIGDQNDVQIDMTLTSPMCPVAETLPEEVKTKVEAIEAVTASSDRAPAPLLRSVSRSSARSSQCRGSPPSAIVPFLPRVTVHAWRCGSNQRGGD